MTKMNLLLRNRKGEIKSKLNTSVFRVNGFKSCNGWYRLTFWVPSHTAWWGSIKTGIKMLFAMKWEKIQKRKEKQSLVCLGWKHLVFLRASSIIEKFARNIQRCCWHSPGVTALQLTLQPVLEVSLSVLNTSLTMLLVLLMSAGMVEPQLFSIKVVPSPSVIVRWS